MNPADLNLSHDSFSNLDSTPTLPGSAAASKTTKSGSATPRVDTEPIYTQLRAALGEHFAEYKNALGAFFLGKLNRNELDRVLSQFLSLAPSVSSNPSQPSSSNATLVSTTHLHNSLLSALLANILYRDTPSEPVASWVLATDAPSTGAGAKTPSATAGAGDKVEERNKREVMALSVRDRRRIKGVKDTDKTPVVSELQAYREALEAVPSSAAGGPAIASGAALSKTNFDLEIKRRFVLPLASEACEFPTLSDIQSRIEPICYEEGLGGGVASGSLPACAELMETAAEMYIKELIGQWFNVSRSNGEGLVHTRRYKRQLRREEQALENGEVQRNLLGLLPIEADAAARHKPLDMDDVRLALRLDGGKLKQDQFLAEQILGNTYMDATMEDADGRKVEDDLLLTNGVVNGKQEREQTVDAMDIDSGNWSWQGAAATDRNTLFDVLNGALSVGS